MMMRRRGSISSRYSVSSKPHVHGEAADQGNTLLGLGHGRGGGGTEIERGCWVIIIRGV